MSHKQDYNTFMSKETKAVQSQVEIPPYEKFLFFLVQYNPFLAIYFRRHRPSDGFIYSILKTTNSDMGSMQIKSILFDQIRNNPTDLNKVAFLTKMVFGKHRVPGLVEDILGEDWADKRYDLKDFVLIDQTNKITEKNLKKLYQSIESSFDRWFFCKIYFPHAQRLQLAEHIKFMEELPDQEKWKLIGEDVKKLVYLPSLSSPYPKEHVSRDWAQNIFD
jgi:hypothetical protein